MSRGDTIVRVFVESPHGVRGQTVHIFEMPSPWSKGGRNPNQILSTFEHGSPPKRKRPKIPGWGYDSPAPNSFSLTASYYAQDRDIDDFVCTVERNNTRSDSNGYPRYDYRLMPVIAHASMAAFFEHIGWNPKTRQYRDEVKPRKVKADA